MNNNLIKTLALILSLTILPNIFAQNEATYAEKYIKSLEFKANSNHTLDEQLAGIKIVYVGPDFAKPYLLISDFRQPEFIYDELYDSNIVVTDINTSRLDYWEKYFSRRKKNIPKKIEGSVSEILEKDNLVIASYGVHYQDIVVFKRENSLLIPIFICPLTIPSGGENGGSYMKSLEGDTLLIAYGNGDEGYYGGMEDYYIINDSTFQLIKIIEISGMDGYSYENYIAEYSKIFFYDKFGKISDYEFKSFAKNRDGSSIFREIKSDSIKLYKIDLLKERYTNFNEKVGFIVKVPEKVIQISGPPLHKTLIVKYEGEHYYLNKSDIK